MAMHVLHGTLSGGMLATSGLLMVGGVFGRISALWVPVGLTLFIALPLL